MPFVWQRRRNHLKDVIKSGRAAMALWINIPWPPIVEIWGACGGDAVLIDMEHTTLSFERVENLIIAADSAGISPIVRPAGLHAKAAMRFLDSGAQGLICPDIRTAEEAVRAVRCAKYPPDGDRGWGGSHTRYAMWEGLPAAAALRESDPQLRGVYSNEYVQKVNGEVFVSIIIESFDGVDNINSILDVGGIDAVTFGWADYAVAAGCDYAACESAANQVYDACRIRGIGMALSIGQAGRQEYFPGCYL